MINVILENTFALTILFIVLSTMIAAFCRRVTRDKCLRSFAGDIVTFENLKGKNIWGKLSVESTGLELVYESEHKDTDGHLETSYILYKNEYAQIQAIIRYHDQLSDKTNKDREKQLNRTYHPGFFRRLNRKIVNLFKTVRDSAIEILNLLMARAKTAAPAGGVLTSQDKYVSRMKEQALNSVATSYEPLLERHIGKRVVLETLKGDKVLELTGVLKDYTSTFIEIIDTAYAQPEGDSRKADLVILRKYATVRHLAE